MACNQSTSFESQSLREPGTDNNNNPATISNQSCENMLNTENSQTPEDAPPKGQNESSKEDTVNVGNLDKFQAREQSINYEPGKSPNEIIPNEASLNSHSQAQPNIEPKPPSPKDIATLLAGTNIIDSTKYGSCEVGWADAHLRVEPGINVLAVCKNDECKLHFKDVMCPKGIYPENNGYCPFDKEIHKVHCPVCKKRIKVDNSFGYCFYQCKVEISYMLDDNNSGKLNIEASNNELLFAKCSNSISGHLQYLELQFLN